MNCVIFGYGYMGRIRARVLRQQPEVERVWVVDPALLSHPGSVIDGMPLEDARAVPWGDVDAVFVCTPNHVTAELCVLGLERCGHLFCEKPPGRSWEDFLRIREAAMARPGHTLMFGFNHRLHPAILAAQAMVGQGGLGEILYLKGIYGKSGGKDYRRSWRNDVRLSGGGILLDQGIHMLDLFRMFAGPLQVVDALLTDAYWGCGVEDNAFVLLRSERGVPLFLHSSATLWKHTFRLEIGCKDGYLAADGLLSSSGSYGREQLVIGRRQFEDEATAIGNPREEMIQFDRDDSWEREVREFLAAVREGRRPAHGTLADAEAVMELIRDAYHGCRPVSPAGGISR